MMDLDDPRRLARGSDPEESKAAAESVVAELRGQRARVVLLVKAHPGSIARELSGLAGDSDPRTLNRRLGEAEEAGAIRRGDARRCEITGRMCATWWPAGMGWLLKQVIDQRRKDEEAD